MHTILITALLLADSSNSACLEPPRFPALQFSFASYSIMIKFYQHLLFPIARRLVVFLFWQDRSWTISFSFYQPNMKPGVIQLSIYLTMWRAAWFYSSVKISQQGFKKLFNLIKSWLWPNHHFIQDILCIMLSKFNCFLVV